jgi:hypothetical protein
MEMTIRVIELGPFGCRINRGTIRSLEDLPEGFEAKKIEGDLDSKTVFIEPKGKE